MLQKNDIKEIREVSQNILTHSLKLFESNIDIALKYMLKNYKAYHHYSIIKKINPNMIQKLNTLYELESDQGATVAAKFCTRIVDSEYATIKIFLRHYIEIDFNCELSLGENYCSQYNPHENSFGLYIDDLTNYNRSITNLKLKYKLKSNAIDDIKRLNLNHMIGIDNEDLRIL